MSVQEYRKHHQHYIELSKVNVIKSFHELEALFLRNNLSMQIICCIFAYLKNVQILIKTEQKSYDEDFLLLTRLDTIIIIL